jgi:hypothetical protein
VLLAVANKMLPPEMLLPTSQQPARQWQQQQLALPLRLPAVVVGCSISWAAASCCCPSRSPWRGWSRTWQQHWQQHQAVAGTCLTWQGWMSCWACSLVRWLRSCTAASSRAGNNKIKQSWTQQQQQQWRVLMMQQRRQQQQQQRNWAYAKKLRSKVQLLQQLRLVLLQLLLQLHQPTLQVQVLLLPLTPWLHWVLCCKQLWMLTPREWPAWPTRWYWS